MRKWSFVVAAAGLALAANSARASIITLTFDGVVADSGSSGPNADIDRLGLFGPAGTDLSGLAFNAVISFESPDSPGRHEKLPNAPTTALVEAVTINGVSYSGYDILASQVQYLIGDYVEDLGAVKGIALADIQSPGFLLHLDTFVLDPTFDGSQIVIGGGSASPAGGGFLEVSSNGVTDVLDFRVDRATVSPITGLTPAPEPAAWALMLLGFGVTGGALRRRRGLLM